jgi:hypothetical protein
MYSSSLIVKTYIALGDGKKSAKKAKRSAGEENIRISVGLIQLLTSVYKDMVKLDSIDLR